MVGALLVLAVLAHPAHVHAVGHPGDGLERLGHGGVGQFPDALHPLAALDAAGGLYDDVVAGLDLGPGGVEIVAFSVFFETDRDHLFHSCPRSIF